MGTGFIATVLLCVFFLLLLFFLSVSDDNNQKRIKDLKVFANKNSFNYLDPSSVIQKLSDFPCALVNEPLGGISKKIQEISFLFIEFNNSNYFVFSDLNFTLPEFILTSKINGSALLNELEFSETIFKDDTLFSNAFLLHSPNSEKQAILNLFVNQTRASLLRMLNDNSISIYAKENMIAMLIEPKINILQIPEYIETLNKLCILLETKLRQPSLSTDK
ncbi:MAG: hypothetical protein WDA26_03800 [Pusillimonas sp.]